MANKISSTKVDAALRAQVFSSLNLDETFVKLSDRSFGKLITDDNGIERLVRLNVVVAEVREDMTARELMDSEIQTYNDKQAAKAEKAKARAEKAARDKAKRAQAKAEKEAAAS